MGRAAMPVSVMTVKRVHEYKPLNDFSEMAASALVMMVGFRKVRLNERETQLIRFVR